VRQLVRATKEEINAVRRELLRMEKAGLVKKETRGNRLYYWFNKKHPLYNDLLSLVAKTVGLGGRILAKKSKIGQLKFALLSGRYARGLPTKEGGVDLLLVGSVDMNRLAKIVAEMEKEVNREINYSVMSQKEFEFRKKRRDPFLLSVLAASRIMLIGDEEELVN
jgi:predicted nucleotidyltransferase